MEMALGHLAPHLHRMTEGESATCHLWVTPCGRLLPANPVWDAWLT